MSVLARLESRLREGATTFAHGGMALAVVAGDETGVLIVPPPAGSAFRTLHEATPFHVCSLSKHLLAAAALRLAGDGALDLQAPCTELVPEFSRSGLARAWTLQQLATMQTGLGRTGIAEWGFNQHRPKAERVSRVEHMPLASTPGRGFAYSNLAYIALGLALERATGRSIHSLLTTLYFAPLGLRDSCSAGPDVAPPRHAHAPSLEAGGTATVVDELTGPNSEGSARVYLSARDARSWLTHLLEVTGGGVSCSSLSALARPQTTVQAGEGPPSPPLEAHAYAYGLFVGDYAGTRLLHHGGAGRGWRHQLLVDPRQRRALVLLASTESSRLVGLAWDLMDDLLGREAACWVDALEAEAHTRAAFQRSACAERVCAEPAGRLSPGLYSNALTGMVELRDCSRGMLFLPQDAPTLSAVIEPVDGAGYGLAFEHPAMARQALDPEYRVRATERDGRSLLDVTYFGELARCE